MEETQSIQPKTTLMLFHSDWCANCKRLEPIVAEIGKTYSGQVNTAFINIAKDPSSTSKYNVMSVPTLIILKEGQPEERIYGFLPKDAIIKKLEFAQ